VCIKDAVNGVTGRVFSASIPRGTHILVVIVLGALTLRLVWISEA
jgi:hypothetical protein